MEDYSMNTVRRAEKIFGYGISDTAGDRYFTVVDGVIYTDLFTGDVTIPEYTGTFKKAFNGRVNGVSYFNEIILDSPSKCTREVTLNLDWGSDDWNKELESLLMWLEENPSTDLLEDANIRTKKIEDFSVTMASAEETESGRKGAIYDGWSWYVRSPIIIGISPEQRHDHRYF